MKKKFAEPEMEVVRFSAQEIITAESYCRIKEACPCEAGYDH